MKKSVKIILKKDDIKKEQSKKNPGKNKSNNKKFTNKDRKYIEKVDEHNEQNSEHSKKRLGSLNRTLFMIIGGTFAGYMTSDLLIDKEGNHVPGVVSNLKQGMVYDPPKNIKEKIKGYFIK